jgi:hypothetical protein
VGCGPSSLLALFTVWMGSGVIFDWGYLRKEAHPHAARCCPWLRVTVATMCGCLKETWVQSSWTSPGPARLRAGRSLALPFLNMRGWQLPLLFFSLLNFWANVRMTGRVGREGGSWSTANLKCRPLGLSPFLTVCCSTISRTKPPFFLVFKAQN